MKCFLACSILLTINPRWVTAISQDLRSRIGAGGVNNVLLPRGVTPKGKKSSSNGKEVKQLHSPSSVPASTRARQEVFRNLPPGVKTGHTEESMEKARRDWKRRLENASKDIYPADPFLADILADIPSRPSSPGNFLHLGTPSRASSPRFYPAGSTQSHNTIGSSNPRSDSVPNFVDSLRDAIEGSDRGAVAHRGDGAISPNRGSSVDIPHSRIITKSPGSVGYAPAKVHTKVLGARHDQPVSRIQAPEQSQNIGQAQHFPDRIQAVAHPQSIQQHQSTSQALPLRHPSQIVSHSSFGNLAQREAAESTSQASPLRHPSRIVSHSPFGSSAQREAAGAKSTSQASPPRYPSRIGTKSSTRVLTNQFTEDQDSMKDLLQNGLHRNDGARKQLLPIGTQQSPFNNGYERPGSSIPKNRIVSHSTFYQNQEIDSPEPVRKLRHDRSTRRRYDR